MTGVPTIGETFRGYFARVGVEMPTDCICADCRIVDVRGSAVAQLLAGVWRMGK